MYYECHAYYWVTDTQCMGCCTVHYSASACTLIAVLAHPCCAGLLYFRRAAYPFLPSLQTLARRLD